MTKFKIPNNPDQHRPGHPVKYRSTKTSDRCEFVVRCVLCGSRCAEEQTKIVHQLFCNGEQPEDLPPPRHTGERLDETGLRIFHYEKPRGA